jgi:hypothetical protein
MNILKPIVNIFIKLLKELKRTLPTTILVSATILFIILFINSLLKYLNLSFVNNNYGYILHLPYLNKDQFILYGSGLLASIIVYSQIMSLKQQLQVQTLADYSKQWNSSEMIAKRRIAINILKFKYVPQDVNIDPLEQVLELLEDFSIFANYKVIDQELVWKSTLGWYASRYFCYSDENGSIKAIRKKWGLPDKPDKTYYEELESLYTQYLDNEVDSVMKDESGSKEEKRRKLKEAYHNAKDKFIQSESGFTND